ncbi:hypothetical protein C8R42DRAFT_711205 [Lentinula raphanica]|nr:hypothetical protein C8R42DRAFT_711205 [Lentinula raphanica]
MNGAQRPLRVSLKPFITPGRVSQTNLLPRYIDRYSTAFFNFCPIIEAKLSERTLVLFWMELVDLGSDFLKGDLHVRNELVGCMYSGVEDKKKGKKRLTLSAYHREEARNMSSEGFTRIIDIHGLTGKASRHAHIIAPSSVNLSPMNMTGASTIGRRRRDVNIDPRIRMTWKGIYRIISQRRRSSMDFEGKGEFKNNGRDSKGEEEDNGGNFRSDSKEVVAMIVLGCAEETCSKGEESKAAIPGGFDVYARWELTSKGLYLLFDLVSVSNEPMIHAPSSCDRGIASCLSNRRSIIIIEKLKDGFITRVVYGLEEEKSLNDTRVFIPQRMGLIALGLGRIVAQCPTERAKFNVWQIQHLSDSDKPRMLQYPLPTGILNGRREGGGRGLSAHQ